MLTLKKTNSAIINGGQNESGEIMVEIKNQSKKDSVSHINNDDKM
jgi:hypothetical protein